MVWVTTQMVYMTRRLKELTGMLYRLSWNVTVNDIGAF